MDNFSNLIKPKNAPGIRELTVQNGLSFPSDIELVMLILGSGTRTMPVEKLAQKVISTINETNSDDLIDRLSRINGMGMSKTLAVAAALELGRRRSSYMHAVINRPCDVIPFVQHYAIEQKEHFVCVSLSGAHEVLNIHLVSVGTINRTIVHPREIFAEPIAEHASAIIVCHNHPYGSAVPSNADNSSTKILREAAEILGITFLDHIIITKDDYFSYLENGMFDDDDFDDE